jgi:hypothetical protein
MQKRKIIIQMDTIGDLPETGYLQGIFLMTNLN